MLDQRGQLLRAALGFARLPGADRALHILRSYFDSWAGIGRVAAGMHRQGYDLQLTRYDERGWRATFYASGMEHSATSATGTAWECDAAGGVGWTPARRTVMRSTSHLLFLNNRQSQALMARQAI